MQSIFIGGLLSARRFAIITGINGEHSPINKLSALSRGVTWKHQVAQTGNRSNTR